MFCTKVTTVCYKFRVQFILFLLWKHATIRNQWLKLKLIAVRKKTTNFLQPPFRPLECECSPGKFVWSPLTQPWHPLMRKKRSDTQRWKRWQMIIENLRRQPLQIALGSTMTFWHLSESSKSDKSPHAVESTVPDHSHSFSVCCSAVFSFMLLRDLLRAFPVLKRWRLGVKHHLWSISVL